MLNQVIFMGHFVEVKSKEDGEKEMILETLPSSGIEQIYSFIVNEDVLKPIETLMTDDALIGVVGHVEPRKVGYHRLNVIIADKVRVIEDDRDMYGYQMS